MLPRQLWEPCELFDTENDCIITSRAIPRVFEIEEATALGINAFIHSVRVSNGYYEGLGKYNKHKEKDSLMPKGKETIYKTIPYKEQLKYKAIRSLIALGYTRNEARVICEK